MNIAVILLAGKGSRIKCDKPKQFLLVDNMPLYMQTSIIFNKIKEIDKILLVTSKEYISNVKSDVKQYKLDKCIDVIIGGPTREESAKNAVNYLQCDDNDIVLIHDADRPFVTEDIIRRNIVSCKKYDAVVTAIKENNSVSLGNKDGYISSTLNREEVFIHQTPQTFKYSVIKNVLNKCCDGTDEAIIASKLGYKVFFVEGNIDNKKITFESDLELLKKFKK